MEKMQESINKDLEELKNKRTETNNTITDIKNTPEGINSRISEAEEWISELEDKMVEITSEEQTCPTLCDPVDCSPPGSSIHGILQARILQWVAIPFSRGSSWPRDQTQVSRIGGRCFNLWATREAPNKVKRMKRTEDSLRDLWDKSQCTTTFKL